MWVRLGDRFQDGKRGMFLGSVVGRRACLGGMQGVRWGNMWVYSDVGWWEGRGCLGRGQDMSHSAGTAL